MPELKDSERLKKELGLFDVYAISTGAMFSSGFFLLPGLAAGQSGPAVVLAYLIAGILILPAMVSKAELSTAMPRAGGTYYFLDRSLGPHVGTVGGLGTYLALTLKSAFALLGMGAYLALFIDLPIKPVALALTIVFLAFNLVGAKETTTLQRVLVGILLVVLCFFMVQGFVEVVDLGVGTVIDTQFRPFAPYGMAEIVSTVGFVFVSYAGLTKVASVAEEVRNPDRNVPLGMGLSLLTATVVYVVGVFIMVSVLDPDDLRHDLTPVATAGEAFFDWLPQPMGLILIVAAAVAAFASTGNAGLLSASRYPLAMARDHLVPDRFAELGRFQTPTLSLVVTASIMMLVIVALDFEGVAKLASAFQLLIFMLVNLAVVVMRESKIMSYAPGYSSPLYPWTQIVGIVSPVVLIAFMGWLAILFTVGIIAVCLAWYYYYAKERVVRDGAVYHWFERLGRRRYEGIHAELRGILKEKGLQSGDPFEYVVARAPFIDLEDELEYSDVVDRVAPVLARDVPWSRDAIRREFLEGSGMGATPVAPGIALPHVLIDDLDDPYLIIVRSRRGVPLPTAAASDGADPSTKSAETACAHAFFFLASPAVDPGRHLRILAGIARRADDEDFLSKWIAAESEKEVIGLLLHHRYFHSVRLESGTSDFVGKKIQSVDLPASCLIAVIRRNDQIVIPRGGTVLREGDTLTIIGSSESINELRQHLSEE